VNYKGKGGGLLSLVKNPKFGDGQVEGKRESRTNCKSSLSKSVGKNRMVKGIIVFGGRQKSPVPRELQMGGLGGGGVRATGDVYLGEGGFYRIGSKRLGRRKLFLKGSMGTRRSVDRVGKNDLIPGTEGGQRKNRYVENTGSKKKVPHSGKVLNGTEWDS